MDDVTANARIGGLPQERPDPLGRAEPVEDRRRVGLALGEYFVCRIGRIAGKRPGNFRRRNLDRPLPVNLELREDRQELCLVGLRGQLGQQIGLVLGITGQQVGRHFSLALRPLGFRDRPGEDRHQRRGQGMANGLQGILPMIDEDRAGVGQAIPPRPATRRSSGNRRARRGPRPTPPATPGNRGPAARARRSTAARKSLSRAEQALRGAPRSGPARRPASDPAGSPRASHRPARGPRRPAAGSWARRRAHRPPWPGAGRSTSGRAPSPEWSWALVDLVVQELFDEVGGDSGIPLVDDASPDVDADGGQGRHQRQEHPHPQPMPAARGPHHPVLAGRPVAPAGRNSRSGRTPARRGAGGSPAWHATMPRVPPTAIRPVPGGSPAASG